MASDNKIVRITSKRAGFRRAGMAHPSKPTDYPIDKFTAPQLKQLQAEPMLVVQILDAPPKKEAPKPEGGK